MTPFRKYSRILSLTIFLLGLLVKIALSAEDGPVEEEEGEDIRMPYAISSPASSNSLSAEILAKMRIKLMGVMGIEAEDNNTPKGH